MNKAPETEVAFAEIMGAISMRVLWACVKDVLWLAIAYGVFFGILGFFSEPPAASGPSEWDTIFGFFLVTLLIWGWIYQQTGKRSYHEARWYFPKMNGLVSLFISLTLTLLFFTRNNFSPTQIFIAYSVMLFFAAFSYNVMKCGYYLVMKRRYPQYEYEDFYIPMPETLLKLSLTPKGISGSGD
ncbi:MAG: hypothetical protein ACKOXK_10405 [Chakrabartia sp.]